MIVYWAVPYLLVAAPPAIVLLCLFVGGCAMTRTAGDPADRARFYADSRTRGGEELVTELNRRAAREELRRTIEGAQQ